MDEIILRTSKGDDVCVELQDEDDDGNPLWAIHHKQLLTTSELLALADAIREQHRPRHTADCAIERDAGEPGSSGMGCTCGADASAADVAQTLQGMRARAPASRHYQCPCGALVETTWPNRRVACPECDACYVECDASILRRIPGGDVIIEQVRR